MIVRNLFQIRNSKCEAYFKFEIRSAKWEVMVRKTYLSVFCGFSFHFELNPSTLFLIVAFRYVEDAVPYYVQIYHSTLCILHLIKKPANAVASLIKTCSRRWVLARKLYCFSYSHSFEQGAYKPFSETKFPVKIQWLI